MTDWADEERARLSRECGCIHSSEPIVLALRKAKADGMKEAADLIRGRGKDEFDNASADGLLTRASAIERGTA